MPVTPCPPPIPTAKAPLAIELRYRNNVADPNPLADWSRYTEATKLQLYPAGSEWGVLHERLSAREVQRSFDDPSHPDLKLIEEWHRLTVHAKLDENGTTLRIEIKLEVGPPGPNGEPPTTYTTAYQGHDVLELPHEAGWHRASSPAVQGFSSRPRSAAAVKYPFLPHRRPHRSIDAYGWKATGTAYARMAYTAASAG